MSVILPRTFTMPELLKTLNLDSELGKTPQFTGPVRTLLELSGYTQKVLNAGGGVYERRWSKQWPGDRCKVQRSHADLENRMRIQKAIEVVKAAVELTAGVVYDDRRLLDEQIEDEARRREEFLKGRDV